MDDKKRKVNWSREEEVLLVEEVSKREGILFGKLDGCQRTGQRKTRLWEEISRILNSRGTSGNRSIGEVKKKYQNIKQKAKAKRSAAVRPQTGGGPCPASPTLPEQLVLDNMEGRPSLCGIEGGIDTEGSVDTGEVALSAAVPLDINMASLGVEDFLSNSNIPEPQTNLTTEEDIFRQELQRIQESGILIKEQTKLAQLKQKLTILQIRQIDPFFIE
ncbi:myb/SANT-like DNA-binding domain-containing protein 4 [Haliotis cracherodii]|uniref:myb/SANT-like DNA-binding domain-containing protein 4 n=1 Tax=Haliotis cracherodii TaxID=6455 RepID=UPI0039EBA24B